MDVTAITPSTGSGVPDIPEELTAAQVRTEYVRLMELLTESHYRRINTLEADKSCLQGQHREGLRQMNELLDAKEELEKRHQEYAVALTRNIQLVQQYAVRAYDCGQLRPS